MEMKELIHHKNVKERSLLELLSTTLQHQVAIKEYIQYILGVD